MCVQNEVERDPRVKKMAITLAAAGLDVTVLGISPVLRRREFMLGDARVVLLPIKPTLKSRNTPERRGLVARAARAVAAEDNDAIRAVAMRHKLTVREVAADLGRASRARDQAIAAGTWTDRDEYRHRLMNKAQRVAVKGRTRGFNLWRQANDRLVSLGWSDNWRRLTGEFEDMEMAFGPELDRLGPDVIHAHDFHMIGIAERAQARAYQKGHEIITIYDAHEFVPDMARPARKPVPMNRDAFQTLEAEYIRDIDHVITVSRPHAQALKDHYDLEVLPFVVRNVPIVRPVAAYEGPTVRDAAQLDEHVPTIVYSGGFTPYRSIETIIHALAMLPEVHAILVNQGETWYTKRIRQLALTTGVQDRVHWVGFVSTEDIPGYLAAADIAVHPMLTNWTNHHIALPNKLFEYAHAGLPQVVSNCRAMTEWVQDNDVGASFVAGDPASLAAAVEKVFDNLEHHRANITPELLADSSWEYEQQALLDVYRAALDDPELTVDEVEDFAGLASRR